MIGRNLLMGAPINGAGSHHGAWRRPDGRAEFMFGGIDLSEHDPDDDNEHTELLLEASR